MRLPHLVVLVTGLGLGVLSLVIVRTAPSESLTGQSVAAGILLLGVGASLMACGVISWSRRPSSRFGVLLVAAGFAWLVVELNNPAAGSPVLFTIGLVGYAACPAFVAHAALAYPDGRVGSRLERAGLVLAYASTCLAVGLLPALAFDPAAQGCSDCPRNLVGLTSSAALVESLHRAGLVTGLVWACGLAVLAMARIVRSSPAARLLTGPVLLALVVYLALVAGAYAHGVGRGFLSNDSVDRLLWLGQAAALAALTLGVCLAWARGAWARTSVARLVIDLSQAPAPGQLRAALARELGDPTLDIAYPLGHELRVDADGRAVDLQVTDGQVVTQLVRGGRPVALLLHRADLLDDPGLIENVGAAAGLVLDHERLQAHARAQLEQLRASRIRTVQSGDAERRRLERDLHDGAQQRLVVLSFALQLLRAELGDERAARMDAAEAELRAALGELRELAHGIYPAVLIDEGLAGALEALAETGTMPLAIAALPDERLEPTAEAAAYFLVAEVLKRATGPCVTVRARHANGRLVIDIDSAGVSADELVDLEDRIGALGGELTVQRTPGASTMICAEVPCAS